MTTKAQQIALDNALVAPKNRHVIGKCNMRIIPRMGPKEPTYQVVLDALALTTCYHAFLITAEVPVIYIHQKILNICPRIPGQEFDEPPSEEEALSFIRELGHSGEIKYITDGMHYKKNLDFIALIWEDLAYQIDNKDSMKQDKIKFMHTARDDSLLGTMRFISRHKDTQAYGAILFKAMMNQAMLDYKSDIAISSEVSPSKKKLASKPQPSKKKAPVKATRGKGLNVLLEVALSKAAQLKEATKQSKKDFHISQASGTGDSGEEDDDDEDETDDGDDDDDDADDGNDDDENNDDDYMNDDDDETDSERTESDKIKIPDLNKSSSGEHDEEEENVNERVHTPDDYELTDEENIDDEEKIDEEENNDVTNELFEQEEEDAPVTLTTVHDKTEGPMQSSSISSDFTNKLLNLENHSLDVNEIASLMNTVTIPPLPPLINPLQQQATPTPTPTTSEATTSFHALPYFSSVFKFNDRVTNLEKDNTILTPNTPYPSRRYGVSVPALTKDHEGNKINTPYPEKTNTPYWGYKSLESIVLAKSSSQPKSTYEAAASLLEYELTKTLMDKMEENKSYLRADYKRKLYDALVKSYNTDKDLFDTYDEAFMLKQGRDDKDKDQDPSVGSDRDRKEGSQVRKLSHLKIRGQRKEPSHTVVDSEVRQHQEFDTGNNDEQLVDEAAPERNCDTARAEKPPASFDELIDTSFDFSAFVLNQLNIPHLTQELLVGPAFNLIKGTCKSLTELEYHFKECSKATTERLDWHNPKGKPYPFDLCKPLPLIPDHRGPQVIPQDYFINNDLEYLKGGSLSRKYSALVTKAKAATYDIKWIEDMVPNLWSPVTVDLRKRTAYTGYSDHQGVIYVDQNNRNKLMRTNELHKFSDGTLDFVWTALRDIASGIRMKYLPKKNWSGLGKRRARVMI
ncbi:hypothetical protein Tco_0596682 [Tanacetum coccineum]